MALKVIWFNFVLIQESSYSIVSFAKWSTLTSGKHRKGVFSLF